MIFFWILWAFCAGILATLIYFFLDSVNTTPGGPNALFFKTAFLVLGFLIVVLLCSIWLVRHEYRILAKLLLTIPDLMGLAFLLWLLRGLTWRGRWN